MKLNRENFDTFAAKSYAFSDVSTLETFGDDLKRFKYLRSCFTRYRRTGVMNHRLVLNYFIILHNCFGENLVDMMFFKFRDYHDIIKTFFQYLRINKDFVIFDDRILDTTQIEIDQDLYKLLRTI